MTYNYLIMYFMHRDITDVVLSTLNLEKAQKKFKDLKKEIIGKDAEIRREIPGDMSYPKGSLIMESVSTIGETYQLAKVPLE